MVELEIDVEAALAVAWVPSVPWAAPLEEETGSEAWPLEPELVPWVLEPPVLDDAVADAVAEEPLEALVAPCPEAPDELPDGAFPHPAATAATTTRARIRTRMSDSLANDVGIVSHP